MISKTYTWRGFEFAPSGFLLEQVVDLSNEMGFAYERSSKFYKDFHTHDRLMIIFPRGTSSMEVRTRRPKRTYLVDYKGILLVPNGLEHDDESTSTIYDTMALYPTKELLHSSAKKLGLPISALKKITTDCLNLPGTERLDQLAHEYFCERMVTSSPDPDALTFYGRKIMEAVLTAVFSNQLKDSSTVLVNSDTVTTRALRFIESSLFEPLELPQIAQVAFASVSTLLRKFKADMGMTPFTYIKNRRMEEALRLLKSGDHSVGEVALLVGYENFGSFSEAFKERYGVPPSRAKSL